MGFFYLELLLGWFLVLFLVEKCITWLIDVQHKKLAIAVITKFGLPLPLADEIIGSM